METTTLSAAPEIVVSSTDNKPLALHCHKQQQQQPQHQATAPLLVNCLKEDVVRRYQLQSYLTSKGGMKTSSTTATSSPPVLVKRQNRKMSDYLMRSILEEKSAACRTEDDEVALELIEERALETGADDFDMNDDEEDEQLEEEEEEDEEEDDEKFDENRKQVLDHGYETVKVRFNGTADSDSNIINGLKHGGILSTSSYEDHKAQLKKARVDYIVSSLYQQKSSSPEQLCRRQKRKQPAPQQLPDEDHHFDEAVLNKGNSMFEKEILGLELFRIKNQLTAMQSRLHELSNASSSDNSDIENNNLAEKSCRSGPTDMTSQPLETQRSKLELPFMSHADFEELSENTRKRAVEQLNRFWNTTTRRLRDYLSIYSNVHGNRPSPGATTTAVTTPPTSIQSKSNPNVHQQPIPSPLQLSANSQRTPNHITPGPECRAAQKSPLHSQTSTQQASSAPMTPQHFFKNSEHNYPFRFGADVKNHQFPANNISTGHPSLGATLQPLPPPPMRCQPYYGLPSEYGRLLFEEHRSLHFSPHMGCPAPAPSLPYPFSAGTHFPPPPPPGNSTGSAAAAAAAAAFFKKELQEQTEALPLLVNTPKKKRTKVTDTRLSPRAARALLGEDCPPCGMLSAHDGAQSQGMAAAYPPMMCTPISNFNGQHSYHPADMLPMYQQAAIVSAMATASAAAAAANADANLLLNGSRSCSANNGCNSGPPSAHSSAHTASLMQHFANANSYDQRMMCEPPKTLVNSPPVNDCSRANSLSPASMFRESMDGNDSCDGFQQTITLTPIHLRKAKLMFFYTRYPSSAVLKIYFPDVKFNKNNTAQLVKWFSNFREFYYIQMEKYARQAIAEGLKSADDIRVNHDSELCRVLNLHYNRNNQIDVPDHFRFVVESTLKEFFKSISTNKDTESSWKKPIYKVIARLDQLVPDFFKSANWMDQLADN